MTDIEDDLDWEEWLELTDEQQEAILNREMAALQRKLDAMTIPQQVAYHRYFTLKAIRENRERLRNPKLRRIDIIDKMWRAIAETIVGTANVACDRNLSRESIADLLPEGGLLIACKRRIRALAKAKEK